MVTKQSNGKKTAPAALKALVAFNGSGPSGPEVTDELTIFWDAFSPLNLAGVRQACTDGASLAAIAIGEDDAATFINKYNSIILRAPGKGPFVTSSEARAWDSEKMAAIIVDVTGRANP